ncbi:DUF4214 domain-containing protein [Massilia dura]|uniref:DUF4214 domain-containing protein n=1 Tax=Pseudoduganella dura TaxID=321982 RepID=A0A6I3XSK2_9BURK|nr:DUF4214 domain-containing protein [Pseudoduganella dura]MUI16282.1 DUF4214 domain-containing protein [Pseudoduganella dura]GGY00956.1 hypothetical protein GCM10007386_34970 [Pseudoduganella dura]
MSLITGTNAIDALAYSSWNATAGTAATLTYSFLTRVPMRADAEDRIGFQAMSVPQQNAVRDALAQWASIANVTFVEVAANAGNLQFGTNAQTGSSAYAYLPGTGISSVQMYLNNKESYNTVFTAGSYGPTVLIHEIGHMLGLKHPGDYDATGSGVNGPFLPAATDNGDYTLMSYNDSIGYAVGHKFQTTAMLYDIQAIQYLYGANMSYHAGNDTYVLAANAAPMCIWDAGGADALDFSACTGATVINLNAGAFSETARGLNNVSIAYNVTIESAVAGSGGSTIYANGAGNRLQGGAGADTFHQGAGNDTIIGGNGNDTVVFTRSYASYTVVRDGNTLTVKGEGTDTLTGVESLRFADRVLAADSFAAAVEQYGTDGNDVMSATAAAERIDAGTGLDIVVMGGLRASYQVQASAAGFTVTAAGTGQVDTLVNVERVQFQDASVALDVGGAIGKLYRLYEAAFDRAPDAAGIGFWLASMDRGEGFAAVAQAFTDSPEYLRLYGALDNAGFVERLYINALDRAYDSEGRDFWVAALNAGVTRGDVVTGFSESPELQAKLIGVIGNGVDYIPYA